MTLATVYSDKKPTQGNFKKVEFALMANDDRFPQSIVLRNVCVAAYSILWLFAQNSGVSAANAVRVSAGILKFF